MEKGRPPDDKELQNFIDEAISTMREADIDFDNWNADYFIDATSLQEFLKQQEQFIGRPVETIFTMGCIFNEEDIGCPDNKNFLNLDEPVVIIIDNKQFEVWVYTDSRVKIGLNTLTMKEKSYQPFEWRDVSSLFEGGIIGKKIVGYSVRRSKRGFYDSLGLGHRPDGGDYFDSFSLVLENGKSLVFSGNCEYMEVYAGNRYDFWLHIECDKLFNDQAIRQKTGTDYVSFYPGKLIDSDGCFLGESLPNTGVHICEDDIYELLTAIYLVHSDFDIYGDAVISKNEWRMIMDAWYVICTEVSTEEIEKMLLKADAGYPQNQSFRFMLEMHGEVFVENNHQSWFLFAAFENWLENQLEAEEYITIRGI